MNKDGDTERFEFGRNWYDFIRKNLDPERIEVARVHMLKFLNREDLEGLTFLDIGCGSGLHSLAALQAGAASVHGFDYDAASVAATQYVQNQYGSPPNWSVEQGSVLDDAYIEGLSLYDIVYSWGVLHHTGDVWRAITNAASRLKRGGLFYIALYSADVQIDPPPEFWIQVKKDYASGNAVKRRWMELWYIWRFQLGQDLLRLPDFLKEMQRYKQKRGMNIFTDIRDWLGGWPMEFVRDGEVLNFCQKRGLRFVNIATGEANTEFLFSLP